MPLMLQVRDLHTSILKHASFTLSAAECIAVKGPSGAGAPSRTSIPIKV
jgi:ABC-type iron transport system FetAB ATPase subunit